MELIIEWSREPLNLTAVRAVLQEAPPAGEVSAGEAEGPGEAPVPAGGDLPAGLL
ncbi:MAG: hypothetical protein ACOY93_00595 [Bacillota bacterium]